MGARVAIEMAYQAPERVAGLVLANTGHAPLQQGERERRQRKILMAHEICSKWLLSGCRQCLLKVVIQTRH